MAVGYDPYADDKNYFLTGVLDNIEGKVRGSWDWIQEQMEEDPNSWDDDVWRFFGERVGGALIGAGTGSFGGPKGTLIGGGVGLVAGGSAMANMIGSIPGINKLVEAQDHLAGGARTVNEKLTPWLDPRVAGWGTRILSDVLLERGVRKTINVAKTTTKKVQAIRKAEQIMLANKNPALAGVLMRQIDPPNWKQTIPKGRLPTPEKVRRDIILEKPNSRYPSLEELYQATIGSGEELKKGWLYERPSPTSKDKWTQIGKRLQDEFGGTDDQLESFIQKQQDTFKQVSAEVKLLNEQYIFNYLQFVLTDARFTPQLSATFKAATKKYPHIKTIDDLVYEIASRISNNPGKYRAFDLGHISKSAKNVARQTKPDVVTTADFASNLEVEISKSIRDFDRMVKDPKSGKVKGKLIEKGNINRGSREDLPEIMNLLMGRNPSIEVEYLMYLDPDFEDLFLVIPRNRQDEFIRYIRRGIRKWQSVSAKNPMIGKQQLDIFSSKLDELINDYLKKLDLLDDPAKSDFLDDALDRRKSGQEAIDKAEAETRAIIRKTMPRYRGDQRGAK